MPGLIINTAEKRVQFVLYDENGLLCAQDWQAERNGTEILVPALTQALSALGLTPSSLDRIACVSGPGNFTGIRLGLSTSAGLARAVGAKQAGLNYLQCLACGVAARAGQKSAVFVTARRGWFFFGLYEHDEQNFPRPLGETVLLANQPDGARVDCDFVLGGGLDQNLEAVRALCPEDALFLPAAFACPSPEALLRAESGLDWDNLDGGDPVPLYLRDCDAVENLDQIAPKLGLRPDFAQQRLLLLQQSGPEPAPQ